MWGAMLLCMLVVLPLWTSITTCRRALLTRTLWARSLRTYVWSRLLPVRTIVASWWALILRWTLTLLGIIATIWLLGIVGLIAMKISSTTLIATSTSTRRATTTLGLLV